MSRLSWLALALLVAAGAQAAERVAVRVGEHPGFSRIVFDWSEPAAARLERQAADRAIVHFDRAGRLDLKRFRADPPPEVPDMVAAPGAGGLAVALTVVPDARLRLFESEGHTVLDVLRPETPADAPAATPEDWRRRRAAKAAAGASQAGSAGAQPGAPPRPEPRPAQVGPGPAAPPEVAAVAAPEPAPSGASPPAGEAPISLLPAAMDGADEAPAAPQPAESPAPASAEPKAKKTAGPGEVQPVPEPGAKGEPTGASEPKAGAGTEPRPETEPKAQAKRAAPTSDTAKPGPASKRIVAKPSAPTGRRDPAADPAASTSEPTPVMIDTSPRPGRKVPPSAPFALRFDWADGAAAAFRRDGKLWLVFDRPPPTDLTAELARAAPDLGPLEQLELPGATALRFAAPAMLRPRLRREDSAWIVELEPGDPGEGEEIGVAVEGGAEHPRMLLQTEDPGRIISFTDPDLGDRLVVVPVATPGLRFATTREFPQFRILASHQGLVLQPLSDSLEVAVGDNAVEVRDREGLIVSRGSSLALLKGNAPAPRRGRRLLDLETWRRGDLERFRANKQALQTALALAEPEQAGAARLELAQFYFAHGLATETLSVLRLGELKDPHLAADPRVRLMKGASEFLTDDIAAARQELFRRSLAGEWEAALWRAALAAASHNWEPAAAGFAETEALIADYPHGVRTRLRLLAAETYLAVGEPEDAERPIEAIREDDPSHAEEAQLAFLVARQLQMQGDTEDAAELWRRVAASRHAPSRIRARLALLDLALEDGSLSADEAIAELERLRFAWRGDSFEFALLERLGDLYILRKDYRKGLRLLRRAASQTPDSAASQAVARRMRTIFTKLYLGEEGAELPPLQALALFDEFKELTPPGAEGDEVILRLAERLVDMDLLDRAADILDSQVEYRLEGVAKARVGARLSEVRLLDKQPAKALQALEGSAVPGLPEELGGKRRHLRARALFALGRDEEALDVLGTGQRPASLRLRAEILRHREDWPGVVLALERLVPAAPPQRPLREAERDDLIGFLVALTMAGERDKILALGRSYKEAMASGPGRDIFAFLVGDLETARDKSISEELAQVDDVEAFLASYRRRTRAADPTRAE